MVLRTALHSIWNFKSLSQREAAISACPSQAALGRLLGSASCALLRLCLQRPPFTSFLCLSSTQPASFTIIPLSAQALGLSLLALPPGLSQSQDQSALKYFFSSKHMRLILLYLPLFLGIYKRNLIGMFCQNWPRILDHNFTLTNAVVTGLSFHISPRHPSSALLSIDLATILHPCQTPGPLSCKSDLFL